MLQVENQLVYLDKEVVFSNAWAGKLYMPHQITQPRGFFAVTKSEYLVFNAKQLNQVKDNKMLRSVQSPAEIVEVHAQGQQGFYIPDYRGRFCLKFHGKHFETCV